MPIIWYLGGKPTVCNQLLWFSKGISGDVIAQYFQFLTNFLPIFLYYYFSEDVKHVYAVEIYMVLAACFLRMCVIASKYATMSYEKMALLKSRVLEIDENKSEWTFVGWRQQLDVIIEAELRGTISRLNLDVSTLFFSFLGEVKPALVSELKAKAINENEEQNPASVTFEKKLNEVEGSFLINDISENLSSVKRDTNLTNTIDKRKKKSQQKKTINFQTDIDKVLNQRSYFEDKGELN